MFQDETSGVISQLREEIARMRTKVTKNPDDKDSVVKMEVNNYCTQSYKHSNVNSHFQQYLHKNYNEILV